VCTRDRGNSVARAVASILRSDFTAFRLIIVDQNDDAGAKESLEEFLADKRVEYVHSMTRGLARARNLAISMAEEGVIAMTDDDCEVAPDWISQMVASFAVSEKIGVVLGNVERGHHDSEAGFIPGYVRESPFLARSIADKVNVEGIGASMAIRKSAWTRLAGFDEMLGAGAQFQSADDTDFIIRALLSGYFVYENPKAVVTHHGFRAHHDAAMLTSGYLRGIGATIAKHLKCGHPGMLRVMFSLGTRWAVAQPVVEYGFKPARLPRLIGFSKGFVEGVFTPVDRRAGLFAE